MLSDIKWLDKRNAASQLEPKYLLLPVCGRGMFSTHVLHGGGLIESFPPGSSRKVFCFRFILFFSFLPGIYIFSYFSSFSFFFFRFWCMTLLSENLCLTNVFTATTPDSPVEFFRQLSCSFSTGSRMVKKASSNLLI